LEQQIVFGPHNGFLYLPLPESYIRRPGLRALCKAVANSLSKLQTRMLQ
jgi:hypothetical protein